MRGQISCLLWCVWEVSAFNTEVVGGVRLYGHGMSFVLQILFVFLDILDHGVEYVCMEIALHDSYVCDACHEDRSVAFIMNDER